MATRGPKLKISLFDTHEEIFELGRRWERWIERFERELRYNGIDPTL